MTIDKEKLIELLVARTGLEKEKVEEQLLQLISRVKQAAGEGKSFYIEGLGTFSLSNDTLNFSPADTLETEINHKYAGMKPIELIGAFKETPSFDEEDEELDLDIEEETEKEPESSQQDELQEIFSEESETAEVREPDKSSELPEDLLAVTGAGDSGEEKKPKASFVFDAEGAEEEQSTEQEAPSPAHTASEGTKKDRDPIGTVLTVCVAILAIGVAGWLVYDLGLLNTLRSNNQAESQKEETVQTASGQPGDFVVENSSSQSANEVSLESEANTDAAEQQPANRVTARDVDSRGSVSDYGLMGRATTDNSGYTIVVYSLGSKSTSQDIKKRLESEGYRTVLTSAVVNGKTFWRVGLGQFRTITDAQEAVGKLPEQYKNNHFIKRIQQ